MSDNAKNTTTATAQSETSVSTMDSLDSFLDTLGLGAKVLSSDNVAGEVSIKVPTSLLPDLARITEKAEHVNMIRRVAEREFGKSRPRLGTPSEVKTAAYAALCAGVLFSLKDLDLKIDRERKDVYARVAENCQSRVRLQTMTPQQMTAKMAGITRVLYEPQSFSRKAPTVTVQKADGTPATTK